MNSTKFQTTQDLKTIRGRHGSPLTKAYIRNSTLRSKRVADANRIVYSTHRKA